MQLVEIAEVPQVESSRGFVQSPVLNLPNLSSPQRIFPTEALKRERREEFTQNIHSEQI